MSDNQYWQEQLQQRVGELLARRIGNFAEELQQVQTILNNLSERLPAAGGTITAEETSGIQEHIEQVKNAAAQEVENNFQSKLEQALNQTRVETENQVRQEYEARINDLQSQLESARQTEGGVVRGIGIAAGLTAAGGTDQTKYDALKAAIAEIDAQRQQADVLAMLVRHSSQFAPRAVFFVIKSNHAIGWKTTGFTNGLTDETVRSLNIPVDSVPLLSEAIHSLRTAGAHNSSGVLGPFTSPEASQSFAVPLVIRGKAAAILYVDSGVENQAIQLDALESLMHITAMAIELLPVRRNQPTAAQPAPVPVQTKPTHSAFEVKSEAEPTTTFSTPVVTPLPPPSEKPSEIKEAAHIGSASVASSTANPPINPQSDDEVRAHNDARRFARLLVSEIKLYNEQKVLEGRRSNDLYERLKEDIDRSRQMYEKRVSASVAAKFDYFYDELLHTLGEGDPGKLGRGCPGPTVPVD